MTSQIEIPAEKLAWLNCDRNLGQKIKRKQEKIPLFCLKKDKI